MNQFLPVRIRITVFECEPFFNMHILSFQEASEDLDGLKSAMGDLEKMEKEVAEFFCEDSVSFKMEECFKSLWSFCVKFKKVRRGKSHQREAFRRIIFFVPQSISFSSS